MPEDAALPPERIDLEGLELRRHGVADAAALAEAVGASIEHLRSWMPWATEEAAGVDFQRRRLAEARRAWEEGAEFIWLLRAADEEPVPAGGPVLGSIGLHRRRGPGAIEIGYWLRAGATGAGRMTAAVRAVTAVGLGLAGVEQVEIRCDEANLRSAAIPARLGYRLARVEDDEVTAPGEIGRSMVWVCSSIVR